MQNNRLILAGLAAGALLAGSVSASAALIDFTDVDGYSFTTSRASGTVDGIDFEVRPGHGAEGRNPQLTQNREHVNAPGLAGQGDGLGIDNDELNHREFLTLEFSGPVRVTGLHFLDLFKADDHDEDPETAIFYAGATPSKAGILGRFDGEEVYAEDRAGHLFQEVSTTGSTFSFRVGHGNDDQGVGDFSLAGVEVSAVPLPASALLLGAALGGLGLSRRRAR